MVYGVQYLDDFFHKHKLNRLLRGHQAVAQGIGVSMGGSYGLSKALLNSYTLCLAREHPGLRVNSCSPGMIATDFFGSDGSQKEVD